MSGGSSSLRRLAALYGLLEHARGLEFGKASAAVAEVERATAVEMRVTEQEAAAGLSALEMGDMGEWAIARAAREAAEVRTGRLDVILGKREVMRDEAGAIYRASWLEKEQTKSAADRKQLDDEAVAARRSQRAGDDRYLSRRDWIMGEERRRDSKG